MENLIFLTCFVVFAFLTAFSMLLSGFILGYKSPERCKSSTYECGLAPTQSAKYNKFHIKYFFYLVMVLIYDVASIFLFPMFVVQSSSLKSNLLIFAYIIQIFLALGIFIKFWRKA